MRSFEKVIVFWHFLIRPVFWQNLTMFVTYQFWSGDCIDTRNTVAALFKIVLNCSLVSLFYKMLKHKNESLFNTTNKIRKIPSSEWLHKCRRNSWNVYSCIVPTCCCDPVWLPRPPSLASIIPQCYRDREIRRT